MYVPARSDPSHHHTNYSFSHRVVPSTSHYRQMGVSDAAARLASGRVHPSIAEDTAWAPQSSGAILSTATW